MCKYFHVQASFGCSVNIYTKKYFASNLCSTWHSCIGLLFTNEEQKKCWFVMFDIFASDTGLVYDITDGHKAVALTDLPD